MTSRNTAVYRYHGIFETLYYRRAFPNTAHRYNLVSNCKDRLETIERTHGVASRLTKYLGYAVTTDRVYNAS